MAQKIECDRCGELATRDTPAAGKYRRALIGAPNSSANGNDATSLSADLCEDCARAIVRFAREAPPRAGR